ncbi:hypothetical protein PHMEG_00031076 [Phytophthora megakarya]|uniref:ISXO2-like transposase domain-containing protein n=1 Tax=Phytophthora megakarya TaxID=4795 RepID=A0A225UYM0_9STRA|nr:hypothetical protein PHMEG_00031076 [Phytophthora megakarya]
MQTAFHYHVEDETHFLMSNVMEVTCDEATCMEWCRQVGLIDKMKLCSVCGSEMKASPTRKRWRCSRRNVHPSGKEITFQANELADVCERTVREWYAFCRATCSKELLKAEFKFGGEGHIVEIDENSFAKKRKYNRGRHHKEFWLFDGVEHGTGRWFGRIVYDKRTKQTLLPVIKKFIKPRTKIMSDMFATYVCERGNKQHTLENNRTL